MSAPFFAHVGFDCMVCANKVIAVLTPRSKTAKDYIRLAKKAGTLMDVSMGKTVRSVVMFDNGFILLSHITTTTLRYRFSNLHKPKTRPGYDAYREEVLGEDDVEDLIENDDDEEYEDDDDYGDDTELTNASDDEEEEDE